MILPAASLQFFCHNLFEGGRGRQGRNKVLVCCLLENITSEQASRMTAMDSATSNANEAANKLRIQYNRLRQAKITTELTEIVAGAESV